MIIKRICPFVLAMVLLSCSDKESEEPWALNGTVQGHVDLYGEFGTVEPEQGGAVVNFISGDINRSTTTDSEGDFVAEDLPMGTYNLVVEKPGFATRNIGGFRVLGGKEPLYTITSIFRPSTTRVTDLTAVLSLNIVNVAGTVIHNNQFSYYTHYALLAGTTPDVSPDKFDQVSLYSFSQPSGASFNSAMFLNPEKFRSGSTVYLVAYGSTSQYSYDYDTGQYTLYGVGDKASNVVSFVIP